MRAQPELPRSGFVITDVEAEIADKRYRIIDLQRRIAIHEGLLRKSERFNLVYPERERAKLRARLKKYKHLIGYKEDSDQSLVDQTIEYFRDQKQGWKYLDDDISAAKQRINSLQAQLSAAQRLIDQLKIPEFKCDLLNYDFHECVDINLKLFDALKKMEFHKDDIAESVNSTAKLRKEIETLTPIPPKMKSLTPRHFNVSVPPSPAMQGFPSYESAQLAAAMKSSVNVFIRAQKTEKLEPLLCSIKSRLDEAEKKAQRATASAKRPMPPLAVTPIEQKDARAELAEEKKQLVGLVHETRECQADLDTILTEIPEVRTESPQGLLKWHTQLLEKRDRMRIEYEREIKRARMQLADAKVIRRSRVNSLVRKVGRAGIDVSSVVNKR